MRQALALVLSLAAVAAVATFELAPDVIERVRQRVGWAHTAARPAPEPEPQLEPDPDDEDPVGPSKVRPTTHIVARDDRRARAHPAGRHLTGEAPPLPLHQAAGPRAQTSPRE